MGKKSATQYVFVAVFSVSVPTRSLHERNPPDRVATKEVPFFVGSEQEFTTFLSNDAQATRVLDQERRRFCGNTKATLSWHRYRIQSGGLLDVRDWEEWSLSGVAAEV